LKYLSITYFILFNKSLLKPCCTLSIVVCHGVALVYDCPPSCRFCFVYLSILNHTLQFLTFFLLPLCSCRGCLATAPVRIFPSRNISIQSNTDVYNFPSLPFPSLPSPSIPYICITLIAGISLLETCHRHTRPDRMTDATLVSPNH
jgi:hypothetical protein